MSLKQSILISRINYSEVINLTDGESFRISPYSKSQPLDDTLIPADLPRGITKQSLGDN